MKISEVRKKFSPEFKWSASIPCEQGKFVISHRDAECGVFDDLVSDRVIYHKSGTPPRECLCATKNYEKPAFNAVLLKNLMMVSKLVRANDERSLPLLHALASIVGGQQIEPKYPER